MEDNLSFVKLKKELLIKEHESLSSDSAIHWGLTFRIKAWAVGLWVVSWGYTVKAELDPLLCLLVVLGATLSFWILNALQHVFLHRNSERLTEIECLLRDLKEENFKERMEKFPAFDYRPRQREMTYRNKTCQFLEVMFLAESVLAVYVVLMLLSVIFYFFLPFRRPFTP